MKKSCVFFTVFFLLFIISGCGNNKYETESSDGIEETDELTSFEKEVEEIVLNQVGFKDNDGNDRIEDLMADNGKNAEKMIENIEQDENQEDLDTDTKAMLREKIVSVTINSTQDEYGQSVASAHIFQELYDNYDLDSVDIWWNISDVPDEDARMLYSLKKRTEADLNWDDVFDELENGKISSFGGFTKDIDTFIDWPIE